jgi:hypothetical protein
MMQSFHKRCAGPAAISLALGFAAALVAPLLGLAPAAEARSPLLMEGKKTLFQRVLSRPDAVVRGAPGAEAAAVSAAVAPFTVFYVFDRKAVGGADWLEVGQPADGPAEGWVRSDQVIPWRHTMVGAFTNPAGRERSLFFRSRDALQEVLDSESVITLMGRYRGEAVAGALEPTGPVISIEPAEHVDITRQFYLFPILDADWSFLQSGDLARLLHVASIPLEEPPSDGYASNEDALKDFNVGVLFVIDTTVSMEPYISRTREAVRKIYDRIANSDIKDRVRFGLIGYRDSTELRPELGYVTKVFAPLTLDQDVKETLRKMERVDIARVSSVHFNEDAMAGINLALEGTGWGEFGARYIILISDAGPREANDPASSTHLGPAGLNRVARDRGIAIYAVHLKTEEGSQNHAYAEGAYRALARWQSDTDLYYPIPAGDVDRFGQALDELAGDFVGQVQDAVTGHLTELEAGDDPAARARLVGRAMQLAYLGRVRNVQAPSMFESWSLDRAVESPTKTALDVRILLNKRQLSDLRDVLQQILEAGQATRLDERNFFDQLRSAVAHMSRDPNRVIDQDFRSLGGVLGEYLEGLPYRTQILEIDEDTWLAMGPFKQREILDSIAEKLERYRLYHDQTDLWVALYEGAPDGEKVFPIPIDSLP